MSALNVDFPEQDLADLREIAQETGVPMKAFVRSATADAIALHRARKAAAQEFQRRFADPALAEAIAAAGIDDGPTAGPKGRAA
ncbi:hypothetical protein [Streptomyces niger]|uniref:hypothetical protein n=1 Tax=Streptomyces niger TaxID=66373 RepID=UPI00069BB080|nr:hypothetical protein [Streptomyces niger]